MTRVLLDAAAEYATERWQVKGIRPLFLEITADMLRFMPFVESSGMRYIGESGGNFDRLLKDMTYLMRADELTKETGESLTGIKSHSVLSGKGRGILKRQRRDILMMQDLKNRIAPDDSFDTFMNNMISDADVSPEAWEHLLPLLRIPKPTYMKGLSPHAESFLQNRVRALGLVSPRRHSQTQHAPPSGPVRIQNLTLSFEIDTGILGKSDTGEVRRSFGLDRSLSFRTGVRDLSFDVRPGEICYVYGASGSGKTSLLRLIRNITSYDGLGLVSGSVIVPVDARLGMLDDDFPEGPLVTCLEASSLQEAIYALNAAGLAEPRLYLSPYSALSTGQRYRAQLARLVCSDANLWLLDEFSSGLDDGTMMAVGRSFAQAARRREVICVIAAVRRDPLVNAVAPDVVVQLNQIGPALITRDWRAWSGHG